MQFTKTIKENSIHTFWYNPNNGNVLPEQDAACIASWMHQDKEVYFWTYGEIESELLHSLQSKYQHFHIVDAEQVIPKSKYFVADYSHLGAHGYAMFSDVFRYKMLDMFGGWWLDTDIFLLNDIRTLHDAEHTYAFKAKCWNERYSAEANRLMQNNAALHAEKSGMMNETYERSMLAVEETNTLAASGRNDLVKWGNTGPMLITDMTEEHKYVKGCASDFYLIDFYPHTGSLARYAHHPTTASDVVRFFKAQPVGVHMWNSFLHKSGKLHEKSLFGIALSLAKAGLHINATNVIQHLENVEKFIDVCDANHK